MERGKGVRGGGEICSKVIALKIIPFSSEKTRFKHFSCNPN